MKKFTPLALFCAMAIGCAGPAPDQPASPPADAPMDAHSDHEHMEGEAPAQTEEPAADAPAATEPAATEPTPADSPEPAADETPKEDKSDE